MSGQLGQSSSPFEPRRCPCLGHHKRPAIRVTKLPMTRTMRLSSSTSLTPVAPYSKSSPIHSASPTPRSGTCRGFAIEARGTSAGARERSARGGEIVAVGDEEVQHGAAQALEGLLGREQLRHLQRDRAVSDGPKLRGELTRVAGDETP